MNSLLIPSLFNLEKKQLSLGKEIQISLLASFVIAALAQVSIPLPFTPVPITGQSLGILVLATGLGLRMGAGAVFFYLLEGVLGLPVFANFSGGIHHLFGPTGGYLIGFFIAAVAMGYFGQFNSSKKIVYTLPIFLIGHAIIFAFGSFVLAQYVGFDKVWVMGIAPFLTGALIKTIIAGLAIPVAWKLKK